MDSNFTPDTRARDRYIEWIKRFDDRHAQAWDHLYNNDPEAAMCEATFWGVLQDYGVAVEPVKAGSNGESTPDFKCAKNGEHFYVEVTCLHIDHVIEKTSLPHEPTNGAQDYGNLNAAIFDKVKRKTPQCTDLDAPALVAVGTFHFQASCVCVQKHHIEELLSGDTMLSWEIDRRIGSAAGSPFLSTNLKSAAFLKPNPDFGIEGARLPVSGVLIGGFGCRPPKVLGLLHPHPVRLFNPQLLDRIEFCRLIRATNKTLSTEWVPRPAGGSQD